MIHLLLLTTLVMSWSQTLQIDFDVSLKRSILEGKKTATIRYKWRDGSEDRRDYRDNDGSGIAVFSDGTKLPIRIDFVDFAFYIWDEDNINPTVLRRENIQPNINGFYNLLSHLQVYYPNMDLGDKITIVYFQLLK